MSCAGTIYDSKMSKDDDCDHGGMYKQTQFLTVITALKHSCGKVIFLHLSAILFRGGGGGVS